MVAGASSRTKLGEVSEMYVCAYAKIRIECFGRSWLARQNIFEAARDL